MPPSKAVGRYCYFSSWAGIAGAAAAVQLQLFQPFFTTKPSGEGTGLSLSLAHDIIAQGHGGTLTVASQEGVGTKFTLSLPRPAGA